MSDYGIPQRLTTGESTETSTDNAHQPIARWNTKHAHTLKEGWRPTETTAELTFCPAQMSREDARAMLAELQRTAFEVSRDEALERNATGLEGCNGHQATND